MLTSFSTICEKYEAVLHDYIAHVVSFVVALSTVFVKEREFLLISSLRKFCLLTNIALHKGKSTLTNSKFANH